MMDVPISRLMTLHTDSVDPSCSLGHAVEDMAAARISSLLVKEGERLVGIITERDVLASLREGLPRETEVARVMTSPVITVPADMGFRAAYQFAVGQGIHHLVVASGDGRPLGIVTESDFRYHLALDLIAELGLVSSSITSQVPTFPPGTPLGEVMKAMAAADTGCVLAVEDGRPVGVFTRRDIVRAFADDLPETTPLRVVMSTPVASVPADTPLEEAAHRMNSARIRQLAVIDADGRLTGVLDERNLLRPLELGLLDRLIAERKAAEEERREADARLRMLFDNMIEGVALHELVLDGESRPVNYRVLSANPRFEAMTGLKAEDVVGKTGDAAYGVAEAPYLEDFMHVALTGEPHRFETYFAPLKRHFSISVAPWGKHGFATIFLDITDRKHQEQMLEHMAHYDTLTQLPNRALLADRIRQAIERADRSREQMAVCYMDLDGFKAINDTLGHEVGDRMLVDVAERLRDCVRGGDTVARLGGDEFVLLLGGLASLEECEKALNRLLGAVAAPFGLAGRSCSISASIGVTLYPTDGVDPDMLLRHADLAMYMAKQAGRNRFHIFDSEHDRRARSHQEAVARIEHALEREEFVLYYQPKVDMRRGTVVGLEALIRWQHPQKGLLSPAEFLPLVEDTDLAVPMGDWVIATALRQMAEWQAAGLELAVSVNIAAHHLQHHDFVARLGELLRAHGTIPPALLELEILETAALADISLASRVLGQVRELGVRLALDDFGTGYSSLTYLKSLPVDILKIDQSFVRDMLVDAEDLAIVEGVIGLANVFRRAVIAEGVETAEHGARLLELGCDLAQGYGIARPMPASSVADWVKSYRTLPTWAPDAA